MEATPAGLSVFIIEQTKKHWTDHNRPYLLSLLGGDLRPHGVDYRELNSPQKLKEFVMTIPDVELVTHPEQKAKVGLIPTGEKFEFSDADKVVSGDVRPKSRRHRSVDARHIVVQFLELLSRLDKEDADSVHIPTGVLSRLLREK